MKAHYRLRHTFGHDMVCAGISVPALQQLMGHAHIHTTMLYVQLAPRDVWQCAFNSCAGEYARAAGKRARLSIPSIP